MHNREIIVSSDKIKSTIENLKNKEDFNLLLDITAIDYLKFPDVTPSRFALVYILRDRTFKKEVVVKSYVDDHNLIVDSITDLYYAADWAEREVYDQYGIKFRGHKNLKRVLNHHQFVGHPLRKDYPITKGQICTETHDLMDEMTDTARTISQELGKLEGYSNEKKEELYKIIGLYSNWHLSI